MDRIGIGLIIFLWVLTSCIVVGQENEFREFSILDLETKSPIDGATINFIDAGIVYYSNSDGRFRVPLLSIGDSLEVSHIGYRSERILIEDLKESNVIFLTKVISELSTIEIIGRSDENRDELIQEIELINRRTLRQSSIRSVPDALEVAAGVFVQRSQSGGGSPILRGMEANRVLLIVDGVRMNHALYRSGHLQNSITVDNLALERIEVIYGPGSVIYGSDAMGGVIHYRTMDPSFGSGANAKLDFNGLVRYSSAIDEKTISGGFRSIGKRLTSLTQIRASQYGNMVTGKNGNSKYPIFGLVDRYVQSDESGDMILRNEQSNVMPRTGYGQWDLLHKTKYLINDKLIIGANIQYSNSTKIARFDQINLFENNDQFRYAEWSYGPQERFLGSITIDVGSSRLYDQLKIISSYQRIQEDRIIRLYDDPFQSNHEASVHVYSITADFKKQLIKNHKLGYGLNYIRNQVDARSYRRDILTDQEDQLIIPRYPQKEATMSDYGAYINYSMLLLKNKLQIQGGARFAGGDRSVSYESNDLIEWPAEYLSGVNSKYTAVSGGVGFQYNFNSGTSVRNSIGRSYRAPNIDDIGKLRVKGDFVIIPNLELEPEKITTTEIGLRTSFNKKNTSKMSIEWVAYYSALRDLLVQADGTLENGNDSLQIEGSLKKVQQMINSESGRIFGTSLRLSTSINSLKIVGSISYQRGINKIDNRPLAHIPPLYGNYQITYSLKQWLFRYMGRWSQTKPISEFAIPSSDNIEYATEEGAIGWWVHDIGITWNIHEQYFIDLGVENLLDLHYRPFSSGISRPGRNFTVSLRKEM